MTCFERYRPAILLFHTGLLLVALFFAAVVLTGGTPVTPELYGPAVYAIPAVMWMLGQIVSSGIVIAGTIRPGHALSTAIGGTLSCLYYSTLGALASQAAQGTLIQAGALCLLTPGAAITTYIAMLELRNGR